MKPKRDQLPDANLSMTTAEGILVAVLRMLVTAGVAEEGEAADVYWAEWERCGWGKERRNERIAG